MSTISTEGGENENEERTEDDEEGGIITFDDDDDDDDTDDNDDLRPFFTCTLLGDKDLETTEREKSKKIITKIVIAG